MADKASSSKKDLSSSSISPKSKYKLVSNINKLSQQTNHELKHNTRSSKEQTLFTLTEPSTSSSVSPKQRKKRKSSESLSQKDSTKSLIVNTNQTACTSKSSDEVSSSDDSPLHKTLRQPTKKSQKKSNKKLRKQLEKHLGQTSDITSTKRSAKSKALEAISSLATKIDSKLTKNSKQSPQNNETESSQEEEDDDEKEFIDLDDDEEEQVEEPIELDQEDSEAEEENKTNSKKSKRRSSVNERSRRSSRASTNSNQINDSDQETESYKSRLRRPSNSSSKSSSKLTEISVPVKKIKLSTPASKEPESKLKKLNQKSFSFSPTTSSNESTSSGKISSKETGSCATKSSNLTRRSTATTSTTTAAVANTAAATTSQSLFDSNSFFSKFKTKSKMSQPNNNTEKPESSSSSTTNTSAASTSQPKSQLGLIESESSDTDNTAEFSRLTDLLQSRGLPSHIVNAFGSKVQQFIHRTMSSGISGRFQQLITSLQQPDETVKLTALTELSQLLVMGNEDTLVGFPIKQAVPLLLQCMSSESENFDLMNHACRTLTYMMESLPRSMSIIAEGIGTFLEKLQVIQCMDVAEQSLTALEILSRRHSKQILNATANGSVNACLTFIDFFSIAAQRNALQITANCCQNMIKEEFVNIKPSLPILSQRLAHTDKKSVESVCTVFARLVENFQHDPQILNEIAQNSVLQNLLQLLIVQPPLVSTSMFVTILHTIYLMCSNCTDLAIVLLDNQIEQCLKQLLIGPQDNLKSFEVLPSRSPQELYEIVSIIGEILPKLPHDGIFSIDEALRKASLSHQNDSVNWHWKDENEILRPYTPIDSRIIEAAYVQEEDECILNTMGRTYVIDFNSMLQINEETGTARPVSRKILAKTETQKNDQEESVECKDTRKDYMLKNPKKISNFISSLFQIVYEVYNSSAGPSIKHRSLRTLMRMIYFACTLSDKSNDSNNNTEENLLSNLLRDMPISSHIASMLASQDPKIIVAGLQISDLLIKNLPDVFSIYFYREGVMYQVDKLIESGEKEEKSEPRKTRSKNLNQKPKGVKAQPEKRKAESADLVQQNKETVRKWILDQAKMFKKNFTSLKVNKSQSTILDQLTKMAQELTVREPEHNYLDTLKSLNSLLKKSDISSFEMIHSELIEKLVNFLTVQQPVIEFQFEQNRLKNYTKLNLLKSCYLNDLQLILNNELNCLRVKQFLNTFNSKMMLYYFSNNTQSCDSQMSLLVSKLHNSVNQLEQFAVRVHDIPNSIGSGKNAMKFFTTHQIKCMLQRHPSCPQNSSLRQWKGGHVKVDPLALVSTIEKYLLMRGIHKPQSTAASSNLSSSLPSSSVLTKKIEATKSKSKSPPTPAPSIEAPSTSKNKSKSKKKTRSVKNDEDDSNSDNEDVDIEDDFQEESEEHNFEEEDDEHIIEDNLDDEDLIDEDDEDEDDEDEDDIESAMSAFLGSSNSSRFSSLSTGARGFFSTGLSLGISTQLPKLELLINDQVLPSNMTIYQATKQYTSQENENDLESSLLNNAIWSKVHLIHYRLVSESEEQKKTRTQTKEKTPTPKIDTPSDLNPDITKTLFYTSLNNKKINTSQSDKSLDSIKVLSQLNTLNRSWFKMYESLGDNQFLLNPTDFCNQKLTAKANRQLQDPLIIMTGHLPKWLPDLMNECPFLFPFETRLMFFYQNSLDRDRAMQKLIDLNSDLLSSTNNNSTQNQSDRFKPKLERKKRTVNRAGDLIKQADLILNEFSNTGETRNPKPALLEIQYENEVGTGLGPTLEFYALVSKELQKTEHEMWRGEKIKTNSGDEYFKSANGLYPTPIYVNPSGKQSSKLVNLINKQKAKFKFMGKFMAKAAQDFRVLDIHLSPVFYKWLLDGAEKSIHEEDLKNVDEQLYNSVKSLKGYVTKRRQLLLQIYKQKDFVQTFVSEFRCLEKEVADMELDFTLPGQHNFELVKGGKDMSVNLENLDEYLRLITDWTLIRGVQAQMESFREGFESVLPLSSLKQFYSDELDRFFCGSGFKQWDQKTLVECTRCDHGYTHESKAVKFLFDVMCEFGAEEQRMFLQFVTGSPRLPIGGLSSLIPALTIVRKTMDIANANADNYLPSVMTCVNYLKLPEYSSVNTLKDKLFKAMKDGQLSFHLS